MTPVEVVARAIGVQATWDGEPFDMTLHREELVDAAAAAITALRTLAREQGEERVDLWLTAMLEMDR